MTNVMMPLEARKKFRQLILNHLNTNFSEEVWALHPFLNMYLVSSKGRIKSIAFNRIMKQQVNRNGYLGVNVTFTDKGRRFVLVHRLVCETFYQFTGLRNYFYEVNHIDGNKNNNNLDNLEWLTRDENLEHAKQNKLYYIKYGEDNPNSKLKDQDLKDTIELRKLGFTLKQIAEHYKVNPYTITKAIKRRKINENC